MNTIFLSNRNSFIQLDEIYFWTATINQWQLLLLEEENKCFIIESLRFLSNKKCIDVFAFVIMPNHIHLIWRINKLNGKESPYASLLKYTAHQFQKRILNKDELALENYKVNAANKKHEFWQRDSLAIPIYSENVAFQKLAYIHNNPCSERWNLAKDPCDYIYSTARFYELGIKKFDFIKDLRHEF